MIMYYFLLIVSIIGFILNAQIQFTEGGRVPDMVMYGIGSLLILLAVIVDYKERKERKNKLK